MNKCVVVWEEEKEIRNCMYLGWEENTVCNFYHALQNTPWYHNKRENNVNYSGVFFNTLVHVSVLPLESFTVCWIVWNIGFS